VQYETPELSGFGLLVQYSPDEAKSATRNADLLSTGIKYQNGPAYAALAYEKHRDTFGDSLNVKSSLSNANDPNARSNDQAYRATVVWEFGNTTVEGDYAHIEWKESGGATGRFQSYKHNTYLISADHRIGSWRLAAQYTWGDKGSCALFGGASCTTDGLDGSQASVGASYSLSRRTQIFAMAAWLTNGKSARYVNADWVPSVLSGQDIAQYALGIAHTF
jgi:predicted porin